MTIWFTADHHFGHRNIIRFCNRSWANINDHDAALMENWNACVQPKDTVYHLGDFALCAQGYTKGILQRLNGRKVLIRGNHDKPIKGHLESYFEAIYDYKKILHEKQHIVLFHYPIASWHMKHYGAWHLHGHSHGNYPSLNPKLMVDVGVDVWDYKPVSFEQLRRYFDEETRKEKIQETSQV